jgi:hypothetical protein
MRLGVANSLLSEAPVTRRDDHIVHSAERMGTAPTERDHCNDEGHKDH